MSAIFFLGANSPQGFYSLYPELLPPRRARRIYLLKGGPGCGKSTLMGRVGRQCEQAGVETEYILCSGDPDSLDALLLPRLNIAIADATAPHVLEPKCPGAVERYVDLGACYDYAALEGRREEIEDCMAAYPPCYARAYRCLRAAGELGEDLRACLLTPSLEEALRKKGAALARRLLPPREQEGPGEVRQRFLSAVTCQGQMTLFDTLTPRYPRIIRLRDSFSLAHPLLQEVMTAAVEKGYEAVACPDPMVPDRLLHLLLPQMGLALVSSTPEQPCPLPCCRTLRLDAMADPALLRACRGRLRLGRKLSDTLTREAVSSLARAKAIHDDLEAVYNPHVDFDRVNAAADRIAGEILSEV